MIIKVSKRKKEQKWFIMIRDFNNNITCYHKDNSF